MVASFSFNSDRLSDDDGKFPIRTAGASKVNDRFGNPASAFYVHGSIGSYLNLGTSAALKPETGSISLWFNIDYVIEAGNGYEINPLLLTKCSQSDDFYEAYCIYFMYKTNRIGAAVTQSSLNQVGLHSHSQVSVGDWHHVVITFDNDEMILYIDGKKEASIVKKFTNKYLAGDSILIGNSANTKNKRYLLGAVDDIRFYDRVISAEDVNDLYHAPNPNRFVELMKWLGIGLGILLFIAAIIYILNRRYKAVLKKEIEKNELRSQVYETELKVLKANMNPHFIFNALNSIQKYVLANEKDNAYRYLVKFSMLLRKLLESNTAESITLEEEIDILSRYVEMEAIRFENAFNYRITVDPLLMPSQIFIPPMVIQPFVENAVWHGLLHRKGGKDMVISFSKVDESCVLCVVDDNGIGRKASEESGQEKKRSLAISLNRQRFELIKKIKGINCGFEIVDKTGSEGQSLGTTVNIRIPILDKTDHVKSSHN